MASSTDLLGFLRNEEDSLELRLANWLAKLEASKLPARIRVTWRADGTVSEENLMRGQEPDVIPVTALPASAAALIDSIHAVVTDRLGPAPAGGVLRIRAASKGNAASPEVDVSRKLVLGGSEDMSTMAIIRAESDRLRSENAELRRQNIELARTLVTGMGSTTTLLGVQAKQITDLATQRVAGTTASDFSSIVTIIGMIVMFFFLPQIKMWMGLKPDSSLQDIVNAGKRMMAGQPPDSSGHPPAPAPHVPPPPPPDMKALPPLPPGDPAAGAPIPTPAPASSPVPISPDDVAAKLMDDEKFRTEMATKIMGNPILMMQLQAAAEAAKES